MQLGWIDFSKEDRQKALDVINLLSEQGAVDELGIGIIRDAFANYFFPGTSTIQTRAKYFLIVPYVLREAVDGRYPAHKFTTVVGWYKHATVFRHYQEAVFAPEDIQYYNAIANSSDCVLLPAGIRSRKVQWEVPRKSNGWAYGFGRANVWYASEEDSRLQDYLTRLVKQIDEYDGENWIDKYAE